MKALKQHWPEYLMEGAELAMFMISASLFTILLYHPASPAVQAIPSDFLRRVLTGLAMGLTFSGMSMNPARTFSSAVIPHLWTSLWIYFTAPLLGMLLAAELFVVMKTRVACAKYHHQNHFRCIFCEHQASRRSQEHPGELVGVKPAVAERRI